MTLLDTLKTTAQDFEWYPTTDRMIDVVIGYLRDKRIESVMDIGAGDGRVLLRFGDAFESVSLYAIEKALPLVQAQPERITPVGTEFYEQDLMSLKVDVIFSNPPYSDFEAWMCRIIETGFAKQMFLIVPDRWKDSPTIQQALKKRDALATVIHHDHFMDAERVSRARVDIVRVTFPDNWREAPDPFFAWFDDNITMFDEQPKIEDEKVFDLARLQSMKSISGLVAAFNEEWDRIQYNYRTIFTLDGELLRELGVNKGAVRGGMKKRLEGLKQKYWEALFTHLDVLTVRLSTKTKQKFLRKIASHTTVAFTEPNVYSVVLWALKFANQYFDTQVVELFRELSCHDGVQNYKSNIKTWEKDGWRWCASDHSHYQLDYRIVKDGYQAILKASWDRWEYPGGIHKSVHELLDDIIAVSGNLGFRTKAIPSRERTWVGGAWQNFEDESGRLLFQAKGYMNGNVHLRFSPDVIRAINIEAGRLLGWVRGPEDVVAEMGYSMDDAKRFFGSNARLTTSSVKLLNAANNA